MELRPYQESALDQIRKKFAAKVKKLLLFLATGAGKTFIFSIVLKNCYEKKRHAIMIVRGRKLVKQGSHRLAREGVPHGIMMANNDVGHHNRILVCSIDTLRSRGLRPKADLIVIDEVHLATSDSYVSFLKDYPEAYVLGVTATPFAVKSLEHCATDIIAPISVRELTEQGFLVPAKFFAPPPIDISHVQIDSKTKDYNQRQLNETMDKSKLVGDIVENWRMRGENRPTLCFAVTVAHSQHIAAQFNSAGIAALHCDAHSTDDYREHCMERLKKGEIKVLTNVGIFGLGVDMPFVSCLVLARPTQSLILYIQQVGRGLRISEGKKDCIIIDHAGNVFKHGFPTMDHEATITGKDQLTKVPRILRCEECLAVVAKMPCAYCGFVPETLERGGRGEIEHVEGELQELTTLPNKYTATNEIIRDIEKLDRLVATKGLKPGFVWHKIKEKYGMDIAKFYLSKRFKQ